MTKPLTLLALLAAVLSSPALAQDDPKWSIAIHGGAGTLDPERLTPELRAEYEGALQAALDRGAEIRGEASMAKLAASETCGRVVDAMLQLHGGNGYSREYEIERLYRDARVMRIYEGTSEIQREVIARDVMQAHGGDLELARSGDGGTVFRLTFRVAD